MGLKDWEQVYSKNLESQIDLYIKENGDELITPNSFKTKEQQLSAYRQELMKMLDNKEGEEHFAQALMLIRDQMPLTVSKEVWESVLNEFSHCEANLVDYLESDLNKEDSENDQEFVSIYEMCGFSKQTLEHCYSFGKILFDKENYADSKLVMLFLMRLAPQVPEFWVTAGMCDKKMGNSREAVELYNLAEVVFPENVSFYLYSADNYLALGDKDHAKNQLETAKQHFDHHPQDWQHWQKTYEHLVSKAK